MNKIIKFRGKTVDDGEWVYGSLVVDNDKYYICLGINEHIKRDDYEVYLIEVIPETVGQYTGLHDKNGKEIYEGDIVKIRTATTKNIIGYIEYDTDYCEYRVNINNNEYASLWKQLDIELIGNIYENKNLLEE